MTFITCTLENLHWPDHNGTKLTNREIYDFHIRQMIPESLTARMLNLVELDVHSNQLRSLPNSIGCLSKLKALNVSCNLLVSLPRTIENCRFAVSWRSWSAHRNIFYAYSKIINLLTSRAINDMELDWSDISLINFAVCWNIIEIILKLITSLDVEK